MGGSSSEKVLKAPGDQNEEAGQMDKPLHPLHQLLSGLESLLGPGICADKLLIETSPSSSPTCQPPHPSLTPAPGTPVIPDLSFRLAGTLGLILL